MKIIIAGGRDITLLGHEIGSIIGRSMYHMSEIDEVVSGTARGVDTAGEVWAEYWGIKVTRFKPNWDKFGKKAGILRNRQMADYADALLLVWDGESTGSRNMYDEAYARHLPIYAYNIKTKKADKVYVENII